MAQHRGSYVSILIGILIVCQCPVFAGDQPHAVVTPSSWDYGYVPQKSIVSHLFYLHNTGSAPLSVTKIDAGCSCTSVSPVENPIAPGDSAKVLVTFNSGRYSKGVKKAAKLHTNDTETPVQRLPYTAYVVKRGDMTGDISVVPQTLTWETDKAALADRMDTVKVVNNGSDSVTVAVLCTPERIVDRVDFPRNLAPGEGGIVLLLVDDKAVPDEPGGQSVTVSFAGQDTTIVTIPIEIEQ